MKSIQVRTRRGAAAVYMAVALIGTVGIISLGVDWGRVQVAKAELQTTVDAAARYAVTGLQNDINGDSAAEANARAVIAQNKVDGTVVNFDADEDMEIGTWDTSKRTFTSTNDLDKANAVRLTLRKSASRGNAVPLTFASIIGKPSSDIEATAIALNDFSAYGSAGAGNGRFEYYIPATGNPWLSGMPTGSVASVNNPHKNPDFAGIEYIDDGSKKSSDRKSKSGKKDKDSKTDENSGDDNWSQWGDYASKKGSPIKAGGLSVKAGDTISFDGINGGANNMSSSTLYSADGNGGQIVNNIAGAENGISNVNAPINSLVAVFLSDTQPNLAGATPANLDFSSSSARDYLTLAPGLRQTFFIGDGRTAAGEVQKITVPPGATRMYIGTMDSYEWNNNIGGFELTAHVTGKVTLVQ